MSIRRHPLWCVTNDSNSLREKALGGIHISLLAQHRVNQVAISINGTVKIAPFSLDVDLRFVHVPRSPCLTTSFGSQLIGDQRGKPSLPVPDCLMSELKAALQKHFSQITQAQLVPQPLEIVRKRSNAVTYGESTYVKEQYYAAFFYRSSWFQAAKSLKPVLWFSL